MSPVSLLDAAGTLVQAAAAALNTINATAVISSRMFLLAPSDPVFSPGHLMYFNSNPSIHVH